MRDILGVDIDPRFAELYDAVTQGSFWLPFRGFIVACERHSTPVRRDEAGRLHSLDGPAIAWPDGWGVYAVHGTRVPAAWIEHRDTLDPTTALTHTNIEQRRAAAEIIGWKRVLEHVSARVVDEDKPDIGTLLVVDLPDAPSSKFLRVRCGTGREFVLPVPAEMTTALQANACTYGLDGSEYRPEVRT